MLLELFVYQLLHGLNSSFGLPIALGVSGATGYVTESVHLGELLELPGGMLKAIVSSENLRFS